MTSKDVWAVFATLESAERARAALVDAGVPEARIALSVDLTADGVAAEVPGQAYENQPTNRGGISAWFARMTGRVAAQELRFARQAELAGSGACVLTVDACSRGEVDRAMPILDEHGAWWPERPHGH
jgi:hypothetical protein